MPRLLLAEDEADLTRALTAVLALQGYEVDTASNGREAVEAAGLHAYDCMIFDVMMPVMDGMEAVRRIRETGDTTPVIMLTAKSGVDDRVEGLDAGADDYLTKPFAMKELLARLRSLTRRSGGFAPSHLSFGSVTLNTAEQELSAGNSIRLSRKEFQLMELFMRNPGKTMTTEEIFRRVWKDEEDAGPGLVWVYVSYLRHKLTAIQADISIEGEKDGAYTLVRS